MSWCLVYIESEYNCTVFLSVLGDQKAKIHLKVVSAKTVRGWYVGRSAAYRDRLHLLRLVFVRV